MYTHKPDRHVHTVPPSTLSISRFHCPPVTVPSLLLVVVECVVNSLFGDVVGHVLGLSTEVVDDAVHRGLVLEEPGSDNTLVQHRSTVPRHRGHAPQKEHTLANIVEGEPGEKDVGEGLDYTEQAVDHPVGQPLSVILLVV